MGTIIRTALAFSYDGVVLSKDSASLTNSKVIQSTKGALFSIPLVNNVSLEELKQNGYVIVVTALEGAINCGVPGIGNAIYAGWNNCGNKIVPYLWTSSKTFLHPSI